MNENKHSLYKSLMWKWIIQISQKLIWYFLHIHDLEYLSIIFNAPQSPIRIFWHESVLSSVSYWIIFGKPFDLEARFDANVLTFDHH